MAKKHIKKSKTWLVDFFWFIQQILHTKKARTGIDTGLMNKSRFNPDIQISLFHLHLQLQKGVVK